MATFVFWKLIKIARVSLYYILLKVMLQFKFAEIFLFYFTLCWITLAKQEYTYGFQDVK